MSKFAPEEKAAILEAGRTTVAEQKAEREQAQRDERQKELVDRWNQRNRTPGWRDGLDELGDTEDAMEHWSRLRKQSEEPPREKRDAAELVYKTYDTEPAQRADEGSQDWCEWVIRTIDERIEAEREFMRRVIADALAEHVAREVKKARGELDETIRQVRIEIANTAGAVDALIKTLRAEGAKMIDASGAPSVIRRTN